MSARIRFDRGTLELTALPSGVPHQQLPGVLFDPRTRSLRAPAYRLRELREALRATVGDPMIEAARWTRPRQPLRAPELRPYQQAALDAWELGGRRGVVVLPTGSGKTRVALAALAALRVPTLCMTPTRILMHQWHGELEALYDGRVGVLGDGSRDLQPLTVSTFESAYRQMPRIGDRFALLVIDEAHHFGSGQRDEALEMAIAPFRLGLTATPVRDTTAAERCRELIGPEVFRLGIADLAGRYLADLQLVTLELPLTPSERRDYERELRVYRTAHRAFQRLHPEASWTDFARSASQSDPGRRALSAFRRARALASYSQAKERAVARLLRRHRDLRTLIFTADNAAAYRLARNQLVMPITCDIARGERDTALSLFREGALRALVSARVLNEGIDVPDAEVAILVGDTGGEREFVQRVGRVLRPRQGKRALVYQLLSSDTAELGRALRRRHGLAT